MELSKLEAELKIAEGKLLKELGVQVTAKALVGMSPGLVIVIVKGEETRYDMSFGIEILDTIGKDLSDLIMRRMRREDDGTENV